MRWISILWGVCFVAGCGTSPFRPELFHERAGMTLTLKYEGGKISAEIVYVSTSSHKASLIFDWNPEDDPMNLDAWQQFSQSLVATIGSLTHPHPSRVKLVCRPACKFNYVMSHVAFQNQLIAAYPWLSQLRMDPDTPVFIYLDHSVKRAFTNLCGQKRACQTSLGDLPPIWLLWTGDGFADEESILKHFRDFQTQISGNGEVK
jgi:hypothetical protein